MGSIRRESAGVKVSDVAPGADVFASKAALGALITIPQEYREALGIREGDSVQVTLQGKTLVVRRTIPWSELAGPLGQVVPLLPDDEPGLKSVVAVAWGAEAAA
jgi:AbrB family looped-hinge helix DNA binding protein